MQRKLLALVGGAAILATSGAAVAGALPDSAQDGLARAGERVGITLPASRDDHPGGPSDDTEGDDTEGDDTEGDDTEGDDTERPERPDAAGFGQTVSEAARSGMPQEDGRAFGEWVSESAREAHQPEVPAAPEHPEHPEHPNADSRPGNAPDDVPRGGGHGRGHNP